MEYGLRQGENKRGQEFFRVLSSCKCIYSGAVCGGWEGREFTQILKELMSEELGG